MASWAVEALDLHKSFAAVHAVRGLNLQVERGEVFGLLGPNGAGKTTTLDMLEGLVQPDSGQIQLLGLDWRSHSAQIRQRIGVQFQSTQLDDKIKVGEVLDMYSRYYDNSWPVPDLLRLLQLEDKVDAYQIKLSGGQRQRLALGLALINRPELVFLDEPTTGLDPQARQSFWALVRHLKSTGVTVLITTHYMDEAEALCDRIAIMDCGRVLQLGTPRELIATLQQPTYAVIEFEGSAPDAGLFRQGLGLPVEVNAQHWLVPLQDARNDLQQVLSCVAALNLPMQQLYVRRASLEDVFLQHTGRSLRE